MLTYEYINPLIQFGYEQYDLCFRYLQQFLQARLQTPMVQRQARW